MCWGAATSSAPECDLVRYAAYVGEVCAGFAQHCSVICVPPRSLPMCHAGTPHPLCCGAQRLIHDGPTGFFDSGDYSYGMRARRSGFEACRRPVSAFFGQNRVSGETLFRARICSVCATGATFDGIRHHMHGSSCSTHICTRFALLVSQRSPTQPAPAACPAAQRAQAGCGGTRGPALTGDKRTLRL